MKAIVYDAPRKFEYRDVDTPKIRPNEVLLRVHACGVCGTDLHVHEGEFGPRFPLTPGHEFSGEIVELGSEVTGLNKGQRATASTTMACGKCFYCQRGDFLQCENLDGIGVEVNGAFAEYIKLRSDLVFPIEKLSVRESVMVEPTACAVHGMETLDMKPGSTVLLLGAGPTGQVLAQLLKLNGAARVTVAAPAGPKLDLIARLAADDVVAIDRQDPEIHRRHLRELSPHGFDYVVEATGSPQLLQDAISLASRRGTIMVYAVYADAATAQITPADIMRRELQIKGSFAQIDCFSRALAYLESKKVKVDEIVTHEVPLPDYQKALELAWSRKGIKIAIIP
ncbi:MAG: zinc-dependent alcohol dehydrogenase family protein [Verrucomicrobia bacterium]|nr:zinc-dependent alcohol dehydrogenase family protein [Verrucomicrobiota bacterium]